MVVDPAVLLKEIDFLQSKGIDTGPERIKISAIAHLIMPYHQRIDLAREERQGAQQIGTTGRGIGPAYEDKAARRGIRFVDLVEEGTFAEKVKAVLEEKNFYLQHYFKAEPLDADGIVDQYRGYAERLAPYVANTSVVLAAALRKRQQLLFEGSQGTHLDIDHGTYPYVTSSSTLSANACCGAGLGPRRISHVIGIVKAYTTRVGKGPFITELFDAVGNRLQEKGAEFGATTGRRRRCGWLDVVLLRNAARLNGVTGLAITKLDVLGGLESLKICTAYACRGKTMEEFPASLSVLADCTPVYETLPGWAQDISGIRSYARLPRNVKNSLRRIEELTETPIDIVSIGPDRDQTIVLKNPYGAKSGVRKTKPPAALKARR
jgi:adenylosuccinate synthase